MVQNGRIYIELVNAPFLKAGGSPDEYRAGLDRAIAMGWLTRHESGTYVKFTEAGARRCSPNGRFEFLGPETYLRPMHKWLDTQLMTTPTLAIYPACTINEFRDDAAWQSDS